MSQFFWDNGKWDEAEWAGSPPPEQTWGTDWAWWYQLSNWDPAINLNPLLVEARWTTDSHTVGDGTYRGDLQPGTLTARFWDPGHQLDNLDKFGAVWACYKPTGACWVWFYDSFTRGLFSPGDPAAADCVFTGTMWPSRLTSLRNDTNFASQSVNARFAAIVTGLGAPGMSLPAVTGAVAAQNQTMLASASDTSTGVLLFPGYLTAVRDAATDGIAWMQPTAAPPAAGTLTLNYARWETTNPRTLDKSQVVAGPAVTASIDWLITLLVWAATNGTNAAASTFHLFASNVATVGVQGPNLRLWGDVSTTGAPEYVGANGTGVALVNGHSDATEQVLSSVSLQSGLRWSAAGKPAAADWDPYAHVFSPVDVMSLDTGSGPKQYRVTKSDHRLTASVWQTTHYLDKFTAATPLP